MSLRAFFVLEKNNMIRKISIKTKLCIFFTICLLFCFTEIVNASENYSDYEFVEIDGGLCITKYNGNDEELTIPSTVGGVRILKIGDYAFAENKSIKKLIIPDGIEELGSGTFAECTSITNITIPVDIKYDGVHSATLEEVYSNNDPLGGDYYRKVSTFSGCSNIEMITYTPGKTGVMPDRKVEGGPEGDYYWSYSLEGAGNREKNAPKIKHVVFEEGVTHIGDYAFATTKVQPYAYNIRYPSYSNICSLETVELPESVTSIGKASFAGNCDMTITSLENVTSYGAYAFCGCSSMTNLSINSDVEEIPEYTFAGCEGITTDNSSLVIPESVETLGGGAFANCTGITDITIPVDINYNAYGTQEFEAYIFSSDYGYTQQDYGSKVSTFYNCLNIEKITYTPGKTGVMPDRKVEGGPERDYYWNYSLEGAGNRGKNASKIKHVVFEEGVTHIGDYAFATTKVQPYAYNIRYPEYSNICSLETVELPESVTSIGKASFAGNCDMTISDLDNVTSIGEYAFNGCNCFEELKISKKLESISAHSFENISVLKSVFIPEEIDSIGEDSFTKSDILTIYGYSDSAAKQYADAKDIRFVCVNDIAIVGSEETMFPGDSRSFSASMFIDSGEFIYDFDWSVSGNESDETVIDSDGTLVLSQNETTNEITVIASYEDHNASLTIPVRHKIHIDEEEVVDTGNCGNYWGGSKINWTLTKCGVFNDGTDAYKLYLTGEGSMGYFRYSAPWNQYSANIKCVEIEYGITDISSDAFSYCKRLTDISIPDSVNEICARAFKECISLKSIYIPESVSLLGGNLFYKCINLQTVNIPSSVETIEEYTFAGCTRLKNITIPDGVTMIGGYAFQDCGNLENIILPNSIVEIGSSVFERCVSLEHVQLPQSNLRLGRDVFSGCTSLESIEFSDETSYIGYSCFEGCSSLESVVLPSGMTYIPDYSFSGCSSLKDFNFPDSINSIGISAFSGCKSLSNITIPDSVLEIGDYAFSGCSEDIVTIPSGVLKIGNGAFSSSTNLTKIIFTGDCPVIGEQLCGWCYNFECICVPFEKKAEYMAEKNIDASLVSGYGKTVAVNCSGKGSVALDGGTICVYGEDKYYEGGVITLIPSPDAGYNIASYEVRDEDNNIIEVLDNKIILPNSNVTVSAVFSKEVNNPLIEVDNNNYVYDGLPKEPNVVVKDGEDIVDESEYTVSYSNNINAGNGVITITDNENGDYIINGSKTFVINKADPTYTLPTNLATTCGWEIKSIILPDGWAWVDRNEYSDVPGKHSFNATYTPSDTDNYNILVLGLSVDVSADKTELIDYISRVEEYYNQVKDCEIDNTLLMALKKSIDDAYIVVDNTVATEEEIEAAYNNMFDSKEDVKYACYNKPFVDNVIVKINKIPSAESISLIDKSVIEEARQSYDSLTDDQKVLVGDSLLEKLTVSEEVLAGLMKPSNDVIEMINNLPDYNNLLITDLADVEAAEQSYQALNEEQMKLINYETRMKLIDCSRALNPFIGIKEKIDDLPALEDISLNDEQDITDAVDLYNSLLNEYSINRLDEDSINKLNDSDKTIKALFETANSVKDAIDALPDADDISVNDNDLVVSTRNAYDALREDQKSYIGSELLQKLSNVEIALENAKEIAAKVAEDIAAADVVNGLINNLPNNSDISVTDNDTIVAARAAYDALTEDQKQYVDADTIQKLSDAEAALVVAQENATKEAEDIAAADVVNELINNLPNNTDVSVSDNDAIVAARTAYDALTAEQKDKVDPDMLQKLVAAETALVNARNASENNKTNNVTPNSTGTNNSAQKAVVNTPKTQSNKSGNTLETKSSKPSYSNEWVDGKWYDVEGKQSYSGTLQWKKNSNGWWVEDTKGWYPKNQWQKIDGIWYFFKPDGYMASEEYYNGYWFNKDGSWDFKYYLTWKSNATGWWVEDKSGWWPTNQWLKIDGDWYYFNSDGYMVTNTYIDGYWIGANGVCQ